MSFTQRGIHADESKLEDLKNAKGLENVKEATFFICMVQALCQNLV